MERNRSDEAVQGWTADMELALSKILNQCLLMEKEHRKRYFFLTGLGQYFDLPTIILTSITAVLAQMLGQYLDVSMVNNIVTGLTLIASILVGVKIYLQLPSRRTTEKEVWEGLVLLATNISFVLNVERAHRVESASEFLKTIQAEYRLLLVKGGPMSKVWRDPVMHQEPGEELQTPVQRRLDSSDCGLADVTG